jgi:NTE family protein
MKIGLALGSGASRGWSHIGVIQALEELGVTVDVIAGCSIGAYVGAAYSSGKLPDLADWVETLTEWQVIALLGVGFQRGGLVSGQRVFAALQDKFTLPTFEQLTIPFAAVATDLYSGREVDFRQGSVVDAVRASCAIPGLFPPVLHNNRWLVDGAVVNPVPVNMCRLLGADIVIAVNLSADFRPQSLIGHQVDHGNNQKKTSEFFKRSKGQIAQWFKKKPNAEAELNESPFLNDDQASPQLDKAELEHLVDELDADDQSMLDSVDLYTQSQNDDPDNAVIPPSPSIINAMTGSLDILSARVTRSRLAGDPPDILIEPQLRDFGMMDFHRASELINEGKQSVERIAAQIQYQLNIS